MEPRIEPEAVVCLRSAPPQDLSIQALFESIEWVAPGIEIVQSHQPDWRFASASDPVADGGLHARLLVGPRIPVRALAADGAALEKLLSEAQVELVKDGRGIDSGTGAAVLDGPLHALLHFVRELRSCPGAPALQAGDVVTTGTWTDAWPVAAGESWEARFSSPLSRLAVRFR
ncbi:hydratase [Comamonas endophytica]